jgi:hypothetical protein
MNMKTFSFSHMLGALLWAENHAAKTVKIFRLMKLAIPILLALLIVTFAFSSSGQPGYGGIGDSSYSRAQVDYKAVWQGFRVNTSSLLKSIGATNTEATLLLMQIQTNAVFLEKKWNVWFYSHPQQRAYSVGDEYLASLRGDNRLLTDLKKEKDGQKGLGVLREVALDLEIKAENCRHSLDGLGKEIKVKVHTKAGEKEIGGYEVYFVAKGMFDVKSAHDRFPRRTSPTDEKILCPGRYAMWVRRNGVTGEPITLRIGGHGETHIEIEIDVPAE